METRAADTHGTNPPVDFARTDPGTKNSRAVGFLK
jgi:hypothetical protein